MEALKAVAFDVDGTLTDGRIHFTHGGEASKSFSFRDLMALSLLRRAGLQLALISGEDAPQVDLLAKKLHIGFVRKGTRDKAGALREFAAQSGVPVEAMCFFGDDVNDLDAMEIAGMCACPGDSADEVLGYVMERAAAGEGIVTKLHGGHGSVREFVDRLLAARGLRGRDVFQQEPPQ